MVRATRGITLGLPSQCRRLGNRIHQVLDSNTVNKGNDVLRLLMNQIGSIMQ